MSLVRVHSPVLTSHPEMSACVLCTPDVSMAVIVDKVFMNIYSNNQCNGEQDNHFFKLKPEEPTASTMFYIAFKMVLVVPQCRDGKVYFQHYIAIGTG